MASVETKSKPAESDSVSGVIKLEKSWERKKKGYEGQIAMLQARNKELEAKVSQESPNTSQTEPPQAAKDHIIRPWEKKCRDCGEENPKYDKPSLFCADCRMPMGKKEDADKIEKCDNCEGTKAVVREW